MLLGAPAACFNVGQETAQVEERLDFGSGRDPTYEGPCGQPWGSFLAVSPIPPQKKPAASYPYQKLNWTATQPMTI
jgi:hypothetical protein